MAQMWSIMMNVPCDLEKNMSAIVVYKCQLELIGSCSFWLCTYWFPTPGSVSYLERGVEISNYYSDYFCCSSVLLHVFWCSVVTHIHIKECYVFFENWPLYFEIPVFITDNFLILKSILSEINIVTPAFFSMLTWYIFSIPLLLNCLCLFHLKQVSWNQHIIGSCFFPQSLCLFIHIFKLFPFKVIVNIVRLMSTLLAVFHQLPCLVFCFCFVFAFHSSRLI